MTNYGVPVQRHVHPDLALEHRNVVAFPGWSRTPYACHYSKGSRCKRTTRDSSADNGLSPPSSLLLARLSRRRPARWCWLLPTPLPGGT